MTPYDAEFDKITQGITMETPDSSPYSPYGTPTAPPKAGLTGRGKIAIGMSAAVLASGVVIGFQAHSANEAASEAKAQEIALQTQALELAKLKEMNRAAEANRKVALTADQSRQAAIDTCVKNGDDLVRKSDGFALQTVVRSCQDQYSSTPSVASDSMANAASSNPLKGSDEGVNTGAFVGIGVLLLGLAAAGSRFKRSDAT
ncbi:hypothetical protein [Streptomyces sp. NPDC058657]|uniref:hypothetical protein n=1 Tax=unclassified Streptomyces TaxID=2593676 RepID=UPI003653A640